MSTQVEEPLARTAAAVDMVTTLEIGPWGLDRFLALVGDRRSPRIKYRDGSLTLVSPSRKHERGSDRIDDLIKAACTGLNIPVLPFASTLFRAPGKDHGIEADKSYYVENEAALRGLDADEVDLSVYPPPDLVVEVVVSHGADRSLSICGEMGVPEVWVYRERRRSLEFLHLGPDGRYASAPASRAFPFLAPADVLPWVETPAGEGYLAWEGRLRAWVRDELAVRGRP